MSGLDEWTDTSLVIGRCVTRDLWSDPIYQHLIVSPIIPTLIAWLSLIDLTSTPAPLRNFISRLKAWKTQRGSLSYPE